MITPPPQWEDKTTPRWDKTTPGVKNGQKVAWGWFYLPFQVALYPQPDWNGGGMGVKMGLELAWWRCHRIGLGLEWRGARRIGAAHPRLALPYTCMKMEGKAQTHIPMMAIIES